jgi:hypothetical protein
LVGPSVVAVRSARSKEKLGLTDAHRTNVSRRDSSGAFARGKAVLSPKVRLVESDSNLVLSDEGVAPDAPKSGAPVNARVVMCFRKHE